MSAPSRRRRIALLGSPNSGKTALFNALTGSRQKVANYPGVTVERKSGIWKQLEGEQEVELLDLPGVYSLSPRTPDEQVTIEVLEGRMEQAPDVVLAVVDVTHLERQLATLLELLSRPLPVVLVVNMMDLAQEQGIELNVAALSNLLSVPVIPVSAVTHEGLQELSRSLNRARSPGLNAGDPESRFSRVDQILKQVLRVRSQSTLTDRVDRWLLHPVLGPLALVVVLLALFQSVFSWATLPADAIRSGFEILGSKVSSLLGPGPLQSLIVDGMIAGAGSVAVFLPQILTLFFFVLVLEDSGYMARAAFLMDRLMKGVGLNGRAFIPLLSSYACAIPGIMAARTVEDPKDRLTTILISPLTTCSARLPVYTLLVGAFIPNVPGWLGIRWTAWVMFFLYGGGLVAALTVAAVLKRWVWRTHTPPLLLELPSYQRPRIRSVAMGLALRAQVFLRRAGTVILGLTVALWFFSSYPRPPQGATEPAIYYSVAGKVGRTLEPLFRPLGFDWRITVALIPGLAAREVMVGALSTVYAVENEGEMGEKSQLQDKIRADWGMPTALSLLTWYVFAPQCLSTLAVTRRETNSWKWPLVMALYLFALAYVASLFVFQLASWLGGRV